MNVPGEFGKEKPWQDPHFNSAPKGVDKRIYSAYWVGHQKMVNY